MTIEEASLQENALPVVRPATIGYLPYVALAVGTLDLGLSAMFVRWSGAPGPVAGFYRVSIAAAVMALPVQARARREAGSRPLGRGLSRRHLALAALAGLFFSGDLATWNTSVMLTNVTNASLLGR